MNQLKEEFLEVFFAILPVTLVIILLQVSLIHMPLQGFLQFLAGALMTVVGLALFLFGVKIGLLPIGQSIGSYLPQKGSFPLIILFGFLLGFVVTAAEPDVRIFSSQIDDAGETFTSPNVLIYSIALGVGLFVVLGLIRTIFNLKLVHILLPSYSLAFILGFFVDENFFSIGFDSGGVTTGPITVPFLIALNIGIVSVLGGRKSTSQGFGLVSLASIGPILAVLLLGVMLR